VTSAMRSRALRRKAPVPARVTPGGGTPGKIPRR
jgi:hypothetical protein